MGQWPVVHLNFRLPAPDSVIELFKRFTAVICAAFDEHKYLLEWLNASSEEGAKFASFLSGSITINEAASDGWLATYDRD
jgi:hypothetical protein